MTLESKKRVISKNELSRIKNNIRRNNDRVKCKGSSIITVAFKNKST